MTWLFWQTGRKLGVGQKQAVELVYLFHRFLVTNPRSFLVRSISQSNHNPHHSLTFTLFQQDHFYISGAAQSDNPNLGFHMSLIVNFEVQQIYRQASCTPWLADTATEFTSISVSFPYRLITQATDTTLEVEISL